MATVSLWFQPQQGTKTEKKGENMCSLEGTHLPSQAFLPADTAPGGVQEGEAVLGERDAEGDLASCEFAAWCGE